MKKQIWGNATWYLFHTLAEKLKPEFKSELTILFTYIEIICNNLPCPTCQAHAKAVMSRAHKPLITSSQDNLKNYLWNFHNSVNKRIGLPEFTKDSLSLYKRANTGNIIQNFINVMNENMRNEKAMLNSFQRQLFVKNFIQYINANRNKYSN
jgi:hypothetical protein